MNNEQERMGDACYTVIAGKKASVTGKVMVGHNEDDGGRCIFRYGMVPAKDWPKGSVLPAEVAPSAFAPAKQDIPQVAHTYGYFWGEAVGIEEGKCLGMSGADIFVNENGVCVVTNNGGSTVEPSISGGSEDVFYVVRRAITERATTALEGVMIAARFIRDYGYKACRDYTIADKDEAWVLEVANGHNFVVRKVADDEVVTIPNFFTIRGVDFTGAKELEPGIMGNANWIWSKNLVQDTIDRGLYQPENPEDKTYKDFDFAWCYNRHGEKGIWNGITSTLRMKHGISLVTGKAWQGDNTLVTANHPEVGFPFAVHPGNIPGNPHYQGKFTMEHMRAILRSHFEGTEDDPEEMRAHLPGKNPHEVANRRICTQTTGEVVIVEFASTPALTTVWLAPGRPCELPFFPMHPLGAEQVPDGFCTIKDGAAAMAGHCNDHPGIASWQETVPWFRMTDFENKIDLLHCSVIEDLTKWLIAKDGQWNKLNDEAVAKATSLSSADSKTYWQKWDNEAFAKLYGEIEERSQKLPVATIKADTTTYGKNAATGEIVLHFTLPNKRKANPETVIFGVGMTNSQRYNRSNPFPWQKPMAIKQEGEGWVATFDAKGLIAQHPEVLPGKVEYYLSGNDTQGEPFCGMLVLNILS